MYRFQVFLFFVTAVSSHCHFGRDCHWWHGHHNFHHNHNHQYPHPFAANSKPITNSFESISSALIEFDELLEKHCKDNRNVVTEVYGEEFYILKYNLPGFMIDDIKMQVKHRVIYTTADRANMKPFRDIRILPDIVYIDAAEWNLEGGTLKFIAPYKVPVQTDNIKTCERINKDVKVIPFKNQTAMGIRMGYYN
ncbi:unnamed protein product [Leptidea sinapis]|uniref:Uncharacterized protein n=1 Tax=Leptidea sinapis TaxID=189913 RepID=A0A5E4R206_9NEOP|nr:unnamed protein product [Leptidea sinapis]